MMGPSHAISGAAVWLAGSWAVEHFNVYHQSPLEIAVGTAVCAGAALLPDLDLSGRVTTGQGGATVANTFGRLSLLAAEVVEKVSLAIYTVTRMRDDPPRENGHRTATHTLPFCAGIGALTTWGCIAGGKWAVLGILFLMLSLALRGLMHTVAAKLGWVPITLVSAAAAYGTYLVLPAERGYPLLGVAVGAGCLIHLLGDAITRAGVPLLWPIPTGRRLWRMISLPEPLTIAAGSKAETRVLRTGLVLVGLAAVAALSAPAVADLLARWRPA